MVLTIPEVRVVHGLEGIFRSFMGLQKGFVGA